MTSKGKCSSGFMFSSPVVNLTSNPAMGHLEFERERVYEIRERNIIMKSKVQMCTFFSNSDLIFSFAFDLIKTLHAVSPSEFFFFCA